MQENFDLKELVDLLDTMQLRLLKEKLIEMNEVDIAAFVEELDSEKTVVVYRMLPKELASDVFACLPVEKQEHIINSITDYELSAIVNDLFVDDAVDMLEELPANVVKRVLKNSTPDTRKLINQFLKYPEGSAGSIMTAEYVGLKKRMTVEEAFAYIRRHGVDKETIYTCYVMDAKRTLEGVVTVKDLLMHPYEEVIGNIMDTHVLKAVTTDDQEEVAESFRKYDLLSLRWWTTKTVWWASLPWTTWWMLWSRRPQRTLRRWQPCFPARSLTLRQACLLWQRTVWPGS